MPKLLLSILIVSYYFQVISGITDEEYATMPPFYHTDDYDYCMKSEKALYCSIIFQLIPIDEGNQSVAWHVIKNISQNEKHYRHDRLRHHLCASSLCENATQLYYNGRMDLFKEQFGKYYSQNFVNYDLKGTIIDMKCLEKGHRYPIGMYDLFVASIILTIIIIVIIATIFDLMENLKQEGILVCFSLKNNLNRLIDTQREQEGIFKSFEGVRFCIMYCVVVCHTGILKASVPVANVEYLEKELFNPLTVAIMHSTFLVVVYFAMTGMILGILFFDMIEKRPKLDVLYLIKGVFNRIFRLYPSLLIVILFTSTWMVHLFDGPFWHALVENEYTRCRNNGWTNLLFINNLHKKEGMCLIQTWYLAADIQMFIVVTVILGIIWKHPKHVMQILIGSSLIATLLNFSLHFYDKANMIVPKRIPENFQHTFLDIPEFHAFYTSPQSNFSVYPISLLFGYLYHKTKTVNIFKRKIYVYCWWFIIISIPIALDIYGIIINRPDYKYGRFEAAFYRSIERNLFVIASLTALYGYLKGEGSIIRQFLESSFLQMMGRLTYSAFLVHYVVIRIRLGTMRYPAYFAMIASFYESLGDFVASYLIGFVLFLFVEMPFVQIQKIIKHKIDGKTPLVNNNHTKIE